MEPKALVDYSCRRQQDEIRRVTARLEALLESALGFRHRVSWARADEPQITIVGAGAIPLPIEQQFLKISQVAKTLGVSPETVRQRFRAGTLEGRQDGRLIRIARHSVEAFLAKQSTDMRAR